MYHHQGQQLAGLRVSAQTDNQKRTKESYLSRPLERHTSVQCWRSAQLEAPMLVCPRRPGPGFTWQTRESRVRELADTEVGVGGKMVRADRELDEILHQLSL
ncbi:hypothetical protein PoB_001265800 [Plakobranchus ocellatus]|uniref:Uncharacterized protein n=1 Tax=Plakobranchus ocellatus TaxID=259542 RepID=A0AAV3YV92_9GAST|nr:hypothetical protein PoB_001265800 [Plakobranchus ocellatus]